LELWRHFFRNNLEANIDADVVLQALQARRNVSVQHATNGPSAFMLLSQLAALADAETTTASSRFVLYEGLAEPDSMDVCRMAAFKYDVENMNRLKKEGTSAAMNDFAAAFGAVAFHQGSNTADHAVRLKLLASLDRGAFVFGWGNFDELQYPQRRPLAFSMLRANGRETWRCFLPFVTSRCCPSITVVGGPPLAADNKVATALCSSH